MFKSEQYSNFKWVLYFVDNVPASLRRPAGFQVRPSDAKRALLGGDPRRGVPVRRPRNVKEVLYFDHGRHGITAYWLSPTRVISCLKEQVKATHSRAPSDVSTIA
eukprot:923579-Prorocentrum_minimum.AAC.1